MDGIPQRKDAKQCFLYYKYKVERHYSEKNDESILANLSCKIKILLYESSICANILIHEYQKTQNFMSI